MSGATLQYLLRLELWGLVAALVQGGLLWLSWLAWERATAPSAAGLRHRIACVHLAAVALLPVLTVAILHLSVAGTAAASPMGSVKGLPPLMNADGLAMRLAQLVGVAWLAGAAAMILAVARQALALARIRQGAAPAALVEELARLARGWPGSATLAVKGADVAGPQVVGWLQPVLLAPRDLERRLGPDERQAVLLHELAHVRRSDFAWNLLHRLILTLVWFHPAAWALYGRLSREREVCCDALAVRHGGSAGALARALVRLAEGAPGPALAMGGAATATELACRIERLFAVPSQSRRRGWLPAAALLASCLSLAALAAGRLGANDPAMGALCSASALAPTISISARDPAGTFALRVRRGRVIAASLQERRLQPGQIVQKGSQVILVGARREPLLALTVEPWGRIRWQARA